jgi:hypothetical protein
VRALSRIRLRPAHLLLLALLGCAALKQRVWGWGAGSATEGAPVLPAAVDGERGRPLELGPSERLLAGQPGVTLERRAYGPSQVALVSTTGVRELHPPRVCLKAAGLEVVQRAEEHEGGACLVHLRVRDDDDRIAHLYYTYLGDGRASCDLWRRAGAAALARLGGRPARWSTLQLLDRDPRRARRRMLDLLQQLAPQTRRKR